MPGWQVQAALLTCVLHSRTGCLSWPWLPAPICLLLRWGLCSPLLAVLCPLLRATLLCYSHLELMFSPSS